MPGYDEHNIDLKSVLKFVFLCTGPPIKQDRAAVTAVNIKTAAIRGVIRLNFPIFVILIISQYTIH